MSMISFRFLNGASCCIWHGAKKVQLISVQLLFEVNGSNIRNIVKSHVLDSKASSFKTFQVTMFFSNIPLCLPLTLLHVVPMRWLDHFLIQTSPSSQHNSPLLGITSAVYIFPPMLMEIWRVQGCLGQISKTNTSPPKKKLSHRFKRFYVFWSFRKNHIATVVRGFSVFHDWGFVNPNKGKFGHLHGVPRDPRPPSSLQPPKVRKDPNENLEPRWERWTEGVPWSSEWLLPGSLGEAAKTLPPRITSGVEVSWKIFGVLLRSYNLRPIIFGGVSPII